MDVLVIGYGKIGRIKSLIWHSLGRRVLVYDIDVRKQRQAQGDGFGLYDSTSVSEDLIVDISTPATLHVESLGWVIENLRDVTRAILIEKPIVSNYAELARFESLVADKSVASRIIVNESYYLSTGLQYVVKQLSQSKAAIQSICVELSKNRLTDVMGGRFTDPHLGAFGIELPHMLALVQGLGLNIDDIVVEDVGVYRGSDAHDEGLKIRMRHGSIEMCLESYLGMFRVDTHGSIDLNEHVVRCLKVATEGQVFLVEFDPVPGLKRYQSRVTVATEGEPNRSTVLDDNHLAQNLLNLHCGYLPQEDELLAVENSLKVSRRIFELKNRANCITVGSISKVKRQVQLGR